MDDNFLKDFRQTITTAEQKLLLLTEPGVSTPPAPGKWCSKEIIGHLIDSASNNHQRFIRAQGRDDLLFDGYAQDDWVALQNYRHEEWGHLIALWKHYNLHLLHAIAQIPNHELMKLRTRHNLHRLAWNAVPEHDPATLEYFIRDYLGHMKHHLQQILR